MSDPKWYRRLPRWAQKLVDQGAHLALGAAIAGLVGGLARLRLSAGRSALVGGGAAALSAAIYEMAQNIGDDSNNVLDAILDASVWTTGGVLVGLAIWGVGRVSRRS